MSGEFCFWGSILINSEIHADTMHPQIYGQYKHKYNMTSAKTIVKK